jgi:hypothetical protein
MTGEFARGILIGISGVLGLAIVSVLVSQRSQTASLIQSAAAGLSQIIGAAVSPVTGGGSGAASVTSNFGLGNSLGNNFSLPQVPDYSTFS